MVEMLKEKYEALRPFMSERLRRDWAATEAKALGHGGIAVVTRATGLSRNTIARGMAELAGPDELPLPSPTRSRQSGGGRKSVIETDPTVLQDLEILVEPTTRGDPMSPLRWTCKSTRKLAEELQGRGHRISSLEEPPQGEINHYAARPLRTFRFGDITIGGLICNDLWANPGCTPEPDPHLTQQLVKMGAQIIFHAVNGGRDGSEWSEVAWHYHESNLRMRARAGRVWIVTVDSSHPTTLPCSAPSGVIDPEGNWVCCTEARGEQFFCKTIEVE